MKHALRGMDDHTSRREATRKAPPGAFVRPLGLSFCQFRFSKFKMSGVRVHACTFAISQLSFFNSITPVSYILLEEIKLEICTDSTEAPDYGLYGARSFLQERPF